MLINYIGTLFFAMALAHTFAVPLLARISYRFPENSGWRAFFHLVSEVEVVFGFWAFLFLTVWSGLEGPTKVIQFQQSLTMTEPLFIFCILVMASTRPVVSYARSLILVVSRLLSRLFKFPQLISQFLCLFTLGPLLGSVITEPAAITVVAILLYRMIEPQKIDERFLYGLLGLLFVNISVGGSLTHFAAPPILIVARIWQWSLSDVFFNLGLAGTAAVILNTIVFIFIFGKKISTQLKGLEGDSDQIPNWVTLTHLLFLGLVVATVHYEKVFFGFFLIFIGLTTVTKKYQDVLKIKEGLLVAFFLAGLIVFGSFQRWWLEPLIAALSNNALFYTATLMTAVTDNAALTYLGSQVPSMSETSKWALVSGALAGGGLTILANAPNPAGFSILSKHFPNHTLNAVKLFLAALIPTTIAVLCFLVLGQF